MSYKAYVVEIKELRKHNNADRLMVATVFGNDVIVGLDAKIGDIMIYFPTDGQLSYDFAKEFELLRQDFEGNVLGGYLDPFKRSIKAIRLRGEKSDGLLVPLNSESLDKIAKVVGLKSADKVKLKVGDTIDILNGVEICKKYMPPVKVSESPINSKGKKASLKSLFPLFKEHSDTSQLAYSLSEFRGDDELTVTLKLHGTSARTSHSAKKANSLLSKILNRLNINLANKWELISGSRRVVLNTFGGGFYGDNNFRKKWHDFFDGKLLKGETVFYEIVGYASRDKLIMGGADNTKMNDKEFVKKYGKTTEFAYGMENGESDIYVYRMNITNEDGHVVEYPTWLAQLRCEQMGAKHVPVLAKFNYRDEEHLMNIVSMYEDGADPIGKTHIREGVIVRVENRERFTAYKQKSFAFKILEGIIKDDATEPDMEEIQDSIGEELAYT